MDTKWKKFKAVTGFTAFVLSVSMLLTSFSSALLFLMDWNNSAERMEEAFEPDYQNTSDFRWQISSNLETFLTMATDGPVNRQQGGYYDEHGWKSGNTIVQDSILASGNSWFNNEWPDQWMGGAWQGEEAFALPPTEGTEPADPPDYAEYAKKLHEQLKINKNILYTISYEGKVKYSNAEGTNLDGPSQTLPEGYNFLLYFDAGKAAMVKDGGEVDVYGDGVYQDGDVWYLPGYSNFTVDEKTAKATICMAVRQTPLLYVQGNYSSDGSSSRYNDLYWMAQNQAQRRDIYIRDGVFLLAGLLFLGLYLLLRKSKKTADQLIARLTGKLWFEGKLLLLILTVGGLFVAIFMANPEFWYWLIRDGYYGLRETGIELANQLSYIGGYFPLSFWAAYLFVNDLRYNEKVWKNSLTSHLSLSGAKLSVQKRMARRVWAILGLIIVWAIPSLFLWVTALNGIWSNNSGNFFRQLMDMRAIVPIAVYLLLLLALLGGICLLFQKNSAIRDISRLTDQIAAVRGGNLTSPLKLPEDAELRQAAENLNDIQHGMNIAMEERIKSERMKVELISNVSHDVKTPLTSIVSYVDLLKQEEGLPEHVKDYVQVLDSKSQRLKTMVQDVFEVSKAASGQLPVKLEVLDLGKLLRQTLADMAERIDASLVTVKAEIPEEPVLITADGQRLYRVFQNLLQNALQYSLDGSRVFVLLKADQRLAAASVKNTSKVEIPDNVNFTERFVRGDQSRTDGGSGLGLSIASSFTEACGGRFQVEHIADLFVAAVEFWRVNP